MVIQSRTPSENVTLLGNGSGEGPLVDWFVGNITGVTILLSICLAIGLMGNGTLLVALARRLRKSWARQRRSALPNVMLVSMVTGDLVTLLIVVPVSLAVIYQRIESLRLCEFANVVVLVPITYTHFLVTVGVPVERYMAVCHPLKTFGRRWMIALNVCLCLLSVVLSAPDWTFSALVPWPTMYGEFRCHSSSELWLIRSIKYLVIATLSLPVFFSLYPLILRRIWVTRKELARQNASDFSRNGQAAIVINKAQFLKDTWLVNVLFLMSVTYFLCWVPPFLITIEAVRYNHYAQYTFLFNNASSFVIFGLTSKSMRQEMLAIVCCGRDKPQESHKSTGHSSIQSNSV